MKCVERFTVVILMLIPYQVNRVMPVACQLSASAHTPNMLVSLKISTIFVVVKRISILFTWFPNVLHFGDDNWSELQLFEIWGVVKLFRCNEIRHCKEIYLSNSWDCCTTVSSLCEWPCWTFGLLVNMSKNELTQFHGNFSFVENTYRVIFINEVA